MIREGTDELTAEEEVMLRTLLTVEDSRWGPPLVDEDWHAICQAIFQGVEGIGMGEHVLQVRVDTQSGPPQKKPAINKKARALWASRNAKS